MTKSSSEFAGIREDYEVRCASRFPQAIEHPRTGSLNLSTLVMPAQNGSGQFLHAYTPDLQDGSAERLARLAEETAVRT